MTGAEIEAARLTLGQMWGLKRRVRAVELGRLLRFDGRDPGRTVREWECGRASVAGPVSVAVQMWLAGAVPPDLRAVIPKAKLSSNA